MKVSFEEGKTGYEINFRAETMEEAAVLVRFGINRTKELCQAESWVTKNLTTHACLNIGMRTDKSDDVRPAKNIGEKKQ